MVDSGKMSKVCITVAGWAVLTTGIAWAFAEWDMRHFDCRLPETRWWCYGLVVVLTGTPLLLLGLYSIKNLPWWIRLLFGPLIVFAAIVLEVHLGINWFITHICP